MDSVRGFAKLYPTPERAGAAAQNHNWLAGHEPLLRVPTLFAQDGSRLQFEYVDGRYPDLGDLPALADHLGALHAGLHRRELHAARLDTPFIAATGLVIPDFPSSRRAAVADRLARGLVPRPGLSPADADRLLTSRHPVAIYKDTNIRNILITDTGPVHVDFDDLTLAPNGYDLAKLLISAAMTHGPAAIQRIPETTERYDRALLAGGLPSCGLRQIAAWCDIHHIFTARYLGQHGYKHPWHHLDETVLSFSDG